jgi:diguanylate cyclase (GGDEF)-like protein
MPQAEPGGAQVAPDAEQTGAAHISCVMSALLLRKVGELGGAVAVAEVLTRSQTTRGRDYLTNIGNWISYDEAGALWNAATEVTHRRSLARAVGAEAVRGLEGSQVATLMRSLGSPEEVYRQLVNTSAKYSTVARLEVTDLGPGFAEIEVHEVPGFPRSEHLCDWTIGLLSQPPVLFGLPPADIRHDACAALGASECRYLATWEIDDLTSASSSPDVVDRLQGELDAMRARLRAMFDTTAELVGPGSLEDALARIAARAAIEFRAPRQLLVVRMAPDEEIVCHAKGFTEEEIERHCEQLMSGDAPDPPDSPESWLMVPVRSATRNYGYLVAAYPEQGRFLPQERQPLEVYARYAAVALDNASARLEAERRSHESGSLLAFSREISVAGTSREIAERVAESVPLVVDSDEVGVYLWNGLELTGYAINQLEPSSAGRERLPRTWTPRPGGSLERFITEPDSEPVFLNSAGGGTRKDPETLGLLGISAAILVPLASRHELLGAVVVMARDRPERLRWTPALSARIAGIAAQATVALENGRLMDVVTYQATHDPLTGLPNRVQFGSDLNAAVARAAREHQLAAVFYIDLDQFKEVNDKFGHAIGDRLLLAVAGRLNGCTRLGDTVARLGGDEFALVVTGASMLDLDGVGARIGAAFALPFEADGVRVGLGVSVGRAVFPIDASDAAGLIRLADAAMYSDKGRRRPDAGPQLS